MGHTRLSRAHRHVLLLGSVIAMILALMPAIPGLAESAQSADERTETTVADQRDQLEEAGARAVPAAGVNQFIPGESETGLWIVRLTEDSLAAHAEGRAEFQQEGANGARLDANSDAAVAYSQQLTSRQDVVLESVTDVLEREVEVAYRYTAAFNGFAVEVSANEASSIAALPGVASVQPDFVRQLTSDVGPSYINALEYVDDVVSPLIETDTGTGTLGEGMVAGILDSGISPANPSFAASVPVADGGDGYVHTYDGDYLGVCDPTNDSSDPLNLPDPFCNDKLIGAWNFVPVAQSEFGARDDDGHGSHTASTTAGNQVLATIGDTETETQVTISGVAPHAHIISYRVCDIGGCPGSAILAGINQTVLDGIVDVINYSIGSSAPARPWEDPDTLAFLDARAAGIFVATSNGNSGPLPATVGSPAGTPWMTSVGASQHSRSYLQTLDVIEGSTVVDSFTGKGFTPGLPDAAPIVYAGDFGSPLCIPEDFEPGTDFSGQIVICDRGEIGRVQKSVNVAELGAVGFIHVNDTVNSASLSGDAFALPGIHLTDVDGGALKDLVAAGAVEGTISPTEAVIDDDFGLLQASFSSRGPNRGVDYLTPDVTAPGVDIIAAIGIATAANNAPVEWGFLSGTSMSSPHVAGAGVLLAAAHPEWTPAEIQSALMLTARYDGLLKEDNATPSDPYDHGAGYVDVDSANDTGLIMDAPLIEYTDANPAEGGDPTDLNHASLSNQDCLDSCSWTRTMTPLIEGDWVVSVVSDDGLDLTTSADGVEVSTTPDTDFDIEVTASVTGAPVGEPLFGRVVFDADDPSVPDAHLTVAVIPSAGVVPDEIVADTRRDAGSVVEDGLETIAADPLEIEVTGLVAGDVTEGAVPQDPTNDEIYDTDSGTETTVVEVPAGTSRFIAEIVDSEAPDLDLFVGTGDTPSAETELCRSTSATAAEFCELTDPEAGTYWILVQNWTASAPDAVDAYSLSTVLVGGDEGNLAVIPSVESPDLGVPYDLTVAYDEEMEPGRSYYGTITLSSDENLIGTIPVTINRFEDDVVKTANVEEAETGDTVSYTIEVLDNVTDTDIEYEIVDELPDGMELVEDSIQVDGEDPGDEVSVDDNTITWTPTQPTLVGLDGTYEVVVGDPAGSDLEISCFNNFSYLDLTAFGIPPGPDFDGDLFAFTAFATGEPLPFYEDAYPGVVFTSDGYLDYTYDGIVFDGATIPDPADPNGITALLMQDLVVSADLTPGSQTGIRLASTGDTPGALWIVDYDTVAPAGGGAPSTFQFTGVRGVSDAPGVYEFGIGFETVGDLSETATVGVENTTGTIGTAISSLGDGVDDIVDGATFCFDYVGPSLDPTVLTFDATVAEGVEGTVTNQAISIDTADPFSQLVPTSASVEVTDTRPEPTDPPTEPTDPPTEPTDPPTEPTDPPTEPTDPPTGEVERLAGLSRIETAVAISQNLFPEDGSADAVIIARADIPFDALASTPLAPELNGPLLLSPTAELHPATLAEIERVLADDGQVIVLGGTAALSAEVEAELAAQGDVTRLSGPTRVETALDVADFIGDPDAILIASADNFPDALTGGAAAAQADGLVLLSPEASAHPAVVAYLEDRPDTDVFAIGGPAAGVFPDATAISGTGREATARLVAEEFFDDPTTIGLAVGNNFADALTGGAHAALSGGPVLLTPTDLLHPEVEAYICGTGPADGFIYGGTAAIDESVEDAFTDRLSGEGCDS